MSISSRIPGTIGTRLISTANTTKNVGTVSVASDNRKKDYYKNLDTNLLNAKNVKPIGWDEALPYKRIPGPKPLPIIGNLWRFFPYVGDLYNIDVLDMHKRFYEQYGDIAVIRNIPTYSDMVLLFSPSDIESLFRNEGVFPIRDALLVFTYYRKVVRKDIFKGTGGLTTLQGIDWYNFRTIVNPILMQPRTALQYVSSMDSIANEFLKNIKLFIHSHPNGEMPPDFFNHICRWALESAAFIALDKRLGCLNPDLPKDSEPQKIIDSAMRMFHLYYKLEVLPSLWKIVSTKYWKEFVAVMDTMTFTFLRYVKEAKERIDLEEKSKPINEMSVFQRLLRIDEKVALAMAVDILTAGVDTTGKTTSAALYYLAINPEVQNNLSKEILTLLPNKDSPVTKDVIESAPYLRAVIKETTRMAPIAIGITRQVIKDMVICGYQIPKGTNILTSNLVLCHNEKYFPRADKFIPERWLRSTEGELSHKHTNPFVYLPFGFGPRSCIGKRLANMEIEILLAKIIRNFSLEWHHEKMSYTSAPLYGIASPLKLRFNEIKE